MGSFEGGESEDLHGADFELDLKPGGAMIWSGPSKDGKPMRYVTGEVLRAEPPKPV